MNLSRQLNHLATQAISATIITPAEDTKDLSRSFAQNFDNVASLTPETPAV